MDDFEGDMDGPAQSSEFRVPCPVCDRKFFPESLIKHERVCAKMAAKRRKTFDSAKQRVQGELSYKDIKQAQKQEPVKMRQNWRAKHEDFINSIRAARGAQHAIATGGPLPPPPPPTINPDYIQCQYCSRRFREAAAERHISFCKEQQQRIGHRPPVDAAAKAKMQARLQYQVPRLKSKNVIPSPGSAMSKGPLKSPSAMVATGASRPRAKTGSMGNVLTQQRNGYHRPANLNGLNAYDDDYGDDDLSPPPRPNPLTSKRHTTSPYQVSRYGDGDQSPGDVSLTGRALRTGRDPRVYAEAKRDIKNSAGLTQGKSLSAAAIREKYMREHASPESPTSPFDRSAIRGHSGSSNHSANSYNHNSAKGFNQRRGSSGSGVPKFCHECGTKYPVTNAKFCCECGVRRMMIT